MEANPVQSVFHLDSKTSGFSQFWRPLRKFLLTMNAIVFPPLLNALQVCEKIRLPLLSYSNIRQCYEHF